MPNGFNCKKFWIIFVKAIIIESILISGDDHNDRNGNDGDNNNNNDNNNDDDQCDIYDDYVDDYDVLWMIMVIIASKIPMIQKRVTIFAS